MYSSFDSEKSKYYQWLLSRATCLKLWYDTYLLTFKNYLKSQVLWTQTMYNVTNKTQKDKRTTKCKALCQMKILKNHRKSTVTWLSSTTVLKIKKNILLKQVLNLLMLDKKCWSPQFTKQPRSHSICIIHKYIFQTYFC